MRNPFGGAIVVDANGKKLRSSDGSTMADGEYMVVPAPQFTMVFNSKGEAVRLGDAAMQTARAVATFDAASHRPGHRTADTATVERNAGARAVHLHNVANAWRAPAPAVSNSQDYPMMPDYINAGGRHSE